MVLLAEGLSRNCGQSYTKMHNIVDKTESALKVRVLGAFTKQLRKATISVVMFVRLPVPTERHSH
jgi:hypothetical protein